MIESPCQPKLIQTPPQEECEVVPEDVARHLNYRSDVG